MPPTLNLNLNTKAKTGLTVFIVLAVLLIAALSIYVDLRHRARNRSAATATATTSTPPTSNKTFKAIDLLAFNGTDPAKPIYIGYEGKVYDVTAGKDFYATGGDYHWLAGKDATDALHLFGGDIIKNKYPPVGTIIPDPSGQTNTAQVPESLTLLLQQQGAPAK